eukprot:1051182-Pelagomonas_calceolata.AAC.2
MSALEHVRGNIRECGRLVGAEVVQDQAYPGWQPNPHSAVLEVRARGNEGLLCFVGVDGLLKSGTRDSG